MPGGLQFDNKISLGHLLSFVFMVVAGITAYADLRSTSIRLDRDVLAISAAADQREARVRAVEIAQASQSSDLRAILLSISRIESQLNKMQESRQ